MSWKDNETRCKSRKPGFRTRCKNKAPAGEQFCEHHRLDLPSFAKDPASCVSEMAKRFPKNHHPACDRKGENDCDCQDFSNGAHSMMALRMAFKQSQLLMPVYNEHISVTMREKVRRIRRYYKKVPEEDLYLPPFSTFRQFRFFCWDHNSQQIVPKVLKDRVRTKRGLKGHLKRLAPLDVYYTTAQWLNPEGIGPDPNGKMARYKFKKKKWCSEKSGKITLPRYHNTLMKRDLYFDVDYDNKDYNEGIKMVKEVIDSMKGLTSFKEYEWPQLTDDDFEIVFSGGKGFHVIVNGFYDRVIANGIPFTEYVNHREKNKSVEGFYKDLVDEVKKNDKLLLDWMVTYDNRRIIRLPGTVHRKTLRVCTRLEGVEDERIGGDFYSYNADIPIP